MKKTKFSVIVYALAMMLVMYNCKKKDAFPTEPNKEDIENLNKVEVKPIVVDPPAPVVSTVATAEASAKATAVNGALDGIASSGTVPASVTTAAAEVSAALPKADVAVLAAVTPATIANISAGGTISPELKTIMDKVAANPAVQAYLPKFNLPTVGGKPISGRLAVTEKAETQPEVSRVSGVEAVQVEDACLVAAEAEFQKVKAKLDASKTTEDGKVTTAYNAAIALIAPAEASCKAGVPTLFAGYKAGVQGQINDAVADLTAAKGVLGDDLFAILNALVNIQAIGAFTGINALEKASLAACTESARLSTENAQKARDANFAKSKAAYDAAIAEATTAKATVVQSCHNQGGGQ